MGACATLVERDVYNIGFYLKQEDPTTGSLTPYTLATASSIVFRMRDYDSTVNTVSAVMGTVASPSNTLGYCKALVTIPVNGTYSSEVSVYESTDIITWEGPKYYVVPELG